MENLNHITHSSLMGFQFLSKYTSTSGGATRQNASYKELYSTSVFAYAIFCISSRHVVFCALLILTLSMVISLLNVLSVWYRQMVISLINVRSVWYRQMVISLLNVRSVLYRQMVISLLNVRSVWYRQMVISLLNVRSGMV